MRLTEKQSALVADHFRWAVKVAANAARRGDRDDRQRCYDAAVDALMHTAVCYDPSRNNSYRGYLTRYVVLGIRGARSRHSRRKPDLPLDAVPSDPPARPDRSVEDRDEVEVALAGLDDRERAILTLAYLEGLGISGAEQRLEITHSNACFWRTRAVAKVRGYSRASL